VGFKPHDLRSSGPRKRDAQRRSAAPAEMYLARLKPGPSRDGCRYVLDQIARLLGGTTAEDVDWSTIGYPQGVALLAALERKGLGIASRKKARSCLRGVLKECWRLGLMDADQLARATDTAVPRGEVLPAGRALSEEECAALWRTALADTSPLGRRDAAVLALLYSTGMRRNELAHLRLEDYDRATGAIRILHGKGGRQREALVADSGIRAVIDAWLAVRGDLPGYLVAPVINGRVHVREAPISGERLLVIIAELCRGSGVAAATPHDVRRTTGTFLADHVPLDVVQQYLGHLQITTTAWYVRRYSGRLRDAAALIKLPADSEGA
jgi:site-specific recombinase XerD